ncbi:MoaD/ThiS family protein [Thermodesulfobacteriota bacterium]
MKPHTQIHLFGSLQKQIEDAFDLPIRFDHDGPMPLLDVLTRFKIPLGMVQLTMVNHKAVHKETVIHPGDRVAVFPREYIVFTDWKDFRF